MNNSTKKEKWWLYPLFFLIGIVSSLLSLYLGRVLPLEGIFQLLSPMVLIYSILFAMGVYAFKERSFRFAVKAFAISLVASSSIFGVSLFLVPLSLGLSIFFLFPLLVLLILFIIGLIAFKERPLVNFTLKAFVVSFAGIFFIFCTFFLVPPISLFYFFGPQQDASTSASIHIEAIAENITIYVPVLLEENGNVMKMYETPTITGNNVTTAIIDTERGQALRISGSGLIEIQKMQEKHGKLKEDSQTSDEFFRGFTISMSNYTSLEPGSEIDVQVYSDSEVEKFCLQFYRDPGNRIDRRVLSIGTADGWCVHLRKGWQVVKLSAGIMFWD